MALTKIVSVHNNLAIPLRLHSRETPADDRLLPPGVSYVFGQNDQGVDVPDWNPNRPDASTLDVTDLAGGRLVRICIHDGALATVRQVAGRWSHTKISNKVGEPTRLTINARGDALAVTAGDAPEIPEMPTPALCGIENGLPYELRLHDLTRSDGDPLFIRPGVLTRTAGGNGVDIPNCGNKGGWARDRLVLVGNNGFQLSLFRIRRDIYYSLGAGEYPRTLTHVPGGHSQADQRDKYLLVTSETDIRLLDKPAGIGDPLQWNNRPETAQRQMTVRAAVELMTNHRRQGDKLVDFHSYVSRIELQDGGGFPLAGHALTITASQPTDVEVNGVKSRLAYPISAKTDARGVVTITNPVGTLGTPTFRLAFDDPATRAPKIVDVHPGDKVAAKLADIKEGVDWRRQRTGSGQRLVPETTSPAHCDVAAQVVREMVRWVHDPRSGVASALRAAAEVEDLAVVGAAVLRPPGHQLQQKLDVAHLPDGHCWGIELHPAGGARFVEKAEAREALSSFRLAGGALSDAHLDAPSVLGGAAAGRDERWWPAIERWFSDLWNSVTKFFFEVTDRVVKVVLYLVEQGVDRVVNFVLDSVSKFFQAVTWLVTKVLGIDMNKLVDWLGFVFDWDAIKHTHKVLVSMVSLALDDAGKQSAAAEASARETFASLRTWLHDQPPERQAVTARAQQREMLGPPVRELTRRHDSPTMAAPQMHWAADALMYGLDGVKSGAGVSAAALQLEPHLLKELTALVEGLPEELRVLGMRIQESLQGKSLGEIVQMVAATIRDSVIDATEGVVALLCRMIPTLAGFVRGVLDQTWDVPLLTPLYAKYIVRGGKTRLVDVCCLLAAIPATIASKLALGRAPYSQADAQAFERARSVNDLLAHYEAGRPVNPIEAAAEGLLTAEAAGSTAADAALDPLVLGQIVTGFIGSSCQVVSGLLYGVSEGIRVANTVASAGLPSGPDTVTAQVVEKILWVKFGIDMVGYTAAGVIGSALYGTYQKRDGKRLSERKEMDLSLAAGQVAFRAKDVLRLTLLKELPLITGGIESALGLFSLALALAVTVRQGQEDPARATPPLTPKQAANVLGTKAGQTFAMGVNQFLAGPREILAILSRDAIVVAKAEGGINEVADVFALGAMQAEIALVAARTFLSTLAIPALGFARGGLGLAYGRPVVQFH